MIDNKEKDIIKEVLEKFIYKLRTNEICFIVFSHYTDNPLEPFKGDLNFDGITKQIKKGILTKSQNYWRNIELSKRIFLEKYISSKESEFKKEFGNYIAELCICDLSLQKEKIEKEKIEKINEENDKLKSILKQKYDTHKEVVSLILKDLKIYPYKSDKIKIFLELGLDVDTIHNVMNLKEKWVVQRGYVEKYDIERKDKIKKKEIYVYEMQSVIDDVLKKLSYLRNNDEL